METQESPNMGKAPERVTFFSTSLSYTIQIQEEKKGFHGEVPFVIPARLIKFEGGNYSTDDEETIKLIRNHRKYKKGRITEERKKEVMEQETHRGSITSVTMEKEAGVENKPQAQAILEKGVSRCEHCEFVAVDDFAGNKLRMHKLGKHRIGMRPNPKAPSKESGKSLAEAKKGVRELEIKK